MQLNLYSTSLIFFNSALNPVIYIRRRAEFRGGNGANVSKHLLLKKRFLDRFRDASYKLLYIFFLFFIVNIVL